MYPIVTVETMREIDERAISGDVSVGFSYMKRASHALATEVEMLANILGIRRVVLFCGKGNNGGDGFYLGKLLLDLNYEVFCYGICSEEFLLGEARCAYDAFAKAGGDCTVLTEESDFTQLEQGITVDALLGTGVVGDPRGVVAKIIAHINSLSDFVIAVDNPSGFNANTGYPATPCIDADMTISLGFPKVGHYFGDPQIIGQLRSHELGYPNEIIESSTLCAHVMDSVSVRELFPRRHYYGSKYDHGVVVALSGSRGMTGAPTLAARAALRTGCGMTYLLTPESTIPSLSATLVEPVMVPVAETIEGSLSKAAVDAVEHLRHKMDALLIGPGLSRNSETAQVIRQVVCESEVPVVLDGDGLSAFVDHQDMLKSVDNLLITPHYGEWRRLFGELPLNADERLKRLKDIAIGYEVYILFKGMPTILVYPSGEITFSTFGNSGLATAGSGDVLAGVIASLVAQGKSIGEAAHVGAALHGMAGDLAVKDLNEYSLIASDLITYLPQAINHFLTGK